MREREGEREGEREKGRERIFFGDKDHTLHLRFQDLIANSVTSFTDNILLIMTDNKAKIRSIMQGDNIIGYSLVMITYHYTVCV